MLFVCVFSRKIFTGEILARKVYFCVVSRGGMHFPFLWSYLVSMIIGMMGGGGLLTTMEVGGEWQWQMVGEGRPSRTEGLWTILEGAGECSWRACLWWWRTCWQGLVGGSGLVTKCKGPMDVWKKNNFCSFWAKVILSQNVHILYCLIIFFYWQWVSHHAKH